MAKRTIESIIDDMDGSPNAREVRFSLDGKSYVIDLCPANSKRLLAILKPYRKAGRLLNPRRTARKPSPFKERMLATSEAIREQRESKKRAREVVRSYRGKTHKKKSG